MLVSSTIIQEIEIMRKSGLASLAFYYYDFREDRKRDLRGLLSSVLYQLCDQSDSYHDILSIFYSVHRDGAQNPSNPALLQCLKELLELPGQAPVYLIIDALDECPDTSAMPSHREEVLGLVEQLIKSRLKNLRLCVTSRPEADIKIVLEPLTFRSISIHDERGQMEDIEYYIREVVTLDPKNRKWKQEDKQLVIDVLTKRADGM
jgi:NACHT domain